MTKIYLASRSPRRAELLKRVGVEFSVISPEVDENVSGRPSDMVMTLARRKAKAGTKLVSDGFVLAADTLVFLDGEPLGKPKDAQDARRMLSRLSGCSHQVMTGMCLRNVVTGEEFVRCDGAVITFDEMSVPEIEEYVASGEPLDKAGAYGIQGLGGQYILSVAGDYYATVGLSLVGLRQLFKDAGIR